MAKQFDTIHIPDQSKLRDYQLAAIDAVEKAGPGSHLIVLPTGSGKCFAPGTKILMYDGTVKNVEDIKEGEQVMGPDGMSRQVVGLAHGFEMMYKIKQSNGIDYTVNESHILSLWAEPFLYDHPTIQRFNIIDCNGKKYKGFDICNIEIKDYIKCNEHFKRHMKGYSIDPKTGKIIRFSNITVEPIGIGEYYGFELIGPDRLFLLADFTVVHNTMTFTHLPRRGRVLILSHRDELVHQPEKYYINESVTDENGNSLPKCTFGVEQASEHSNGEEVVSASVQSLVRRLDKFEPDDFDMIITDECHHSTAPTYRKIYDYFKPRVHLGFTATPDRADGSDLRHIYDDIIFKRDMKWGIKTAKCITDIEAYQVNVHYDLRKVKRQMGDFAVTSLGRAMMEPGCVDEVVRAYNQMHKGQTLIFAVNVEHAHAIASKIPGAAVITGETKNRQELFDKFTNRKIPCIVNVMVACLDDKTKILTDKGFVGIDEISFEHKVANWNFDETVYFEKPLNILKKNLDPEEKMISVKTKNFDFRVTDNHRMVVYDKINHNYKKIDAKDLNRYSVLPTNGIAQPFDIRPFKNIDYTPTNRDISRMKWDMIHKQGYPNNESTVDEAKRRLIRSHTRRYLNPSELTIEQCELIGLWIADGTVQKLKKSGLEYKISQSTAYPKIIEWIENLLNQNKIHYIRREKINKRNVKYVEWSLPRGTGGGSQERKGVYPIEPYLDKNGSDLLWGLNEEQFDAFLKGFWYGDGNHKQADNGMPNSLVFRTTDRKPLELISTIACVRGWRCSLKTNIKTRPGCKPQQELRMIKHANISMCHKTPIITEEYKPQKVWCVTTSSGNIITKRNGKIVVMGNCEGTDLPLVETVIMARPTTNQSLYLQILGRGLRLYPGKKACRLIDCVGVTSKIKPINVGDLFGLNMNELPETQKKKLNGKLLTEYEDAIEEILDAPEFWISANRVQIFEEDNGLDLHDINFVPLANKTLKLSLAKFDIYVPMADELGETQIFYCNKNAKTPMGYMKRALIQDAIDALYDLLQNSYQDDEQLWNHKKIVKGWGKYPASDKQKAYIANLMQITGNRLEGIQVQALTKAEAGIIIERLTDEKNKMQIQQSYYNPNTVGSNNYQNMIGRTTNYGQRNAKKIESNAGTGWY